MAFDVLHRGVYTGLIAVSDCLRDYFHVPIIPIRTLRDFFSPNQVRYIGATR